MIFHNMMASRYVRQVAGATSWPDMGTTRANRLTSQNADTVSGGRRALVEDKASRAATAERHVEAIAASAPTTPLKP